MDTINIWLSPVFTWDLIDKKMNVIYSLIFSFRFFQLSFNAISMSNLNENIWIRNISSNVFVYSNSRNTQEVTSRSTSSKLCNLSVTVRFSNFNCIKDIDITQQSKQSKEQSKTIKRIYVIFAKIQTTIQIVEKLNFRYIPQVIERTSSPKL